MDSPVPGSGASSVRNKQSAIMCAAEYVKPRAVDIRCEPAEGELCGIASRVRFEYTKPHLSLHFWHFCSALLASLQNLRCQ